jgi:hypothetical protein
MLDNRIAFRGDFNWQRAGSKECLSLRAGVEVWTDLAPGRCMAALREVIVSAIPRGSGPGLDG